MLLEPLTRSVPRGAMSTIRRRVQEHVRAKTGTKDGQCGVVAWLRGEGLPSMSWAARRVGGWAGGPGPPGGSLYSVSEHLD